MTEENVADMLAQAVLANRSATAQPESLRSGLRRVAHPLCWAFASLLAMWIAWMASGPGLLALHGVGWVSDETLSAMALPMLLLWVVLGLTFAMMIPTVVCAFWVWLSITAPDDRGTLAVHQHVRLGTTVLGV